MRPVPANVAREWRTFTAAVGDRLAAGQRVYGDASLAAAPQALANEIEDELLDLAGWGFLLWRRLRALRGRLAAPPGTATLARTTAAPASKVSIARLPAAARSVRRRR